MLTDYHYAYVCLGTPTQDFYAAFETEDLAKRSWTLSYAKAGGIRFESDTFGLIRVIRPDLSGGGDHTVGVIKRVPIHNHPEHL